MHLGVRGNNHLAIELYEDLGFTEWGRLPNVIEVGDERYDDVRMYRRLNQPAGLVFRGSAGRGRATPRRRGGPSPDPTRGNPAGRRNAPVMFAG